MIKLVEKVFEQVEKIDLKNLEKNMEKVLNEREINVLNLRYKQGLTLEAISKKIGPMTRERVRQIEVRAIAKMRYNEKLFKIVGLYEEPLKNIEENIAIERLKLSTRTYHALKRANICYVNEIVEMADEELLNLKGLGKKGVEEINLKIGDLGYFRTHRDLAKDLKQLLDEYSISKKELIEYVENL